MTLSSIYSHDQFMNPGPAPQPPTNRARLNLTPATNLPGNMSNMSLATISPSSIHSASSFSIGPGGQNISLPLQRSQTHGGATHGGTGVVKQGFAKVKEEGLRGLMMWQTKYLILREFTLDFHKNEKAEKVSFSIQLRDVTGVSRSDAPQFSFEISRLANPNSAPNNVGLALANRDLPQKIVYVQTKSDDELYDWIDQIYNRCPGMGGVSNPTNFSHNVHVGFDPTTGAFVGLPTEWEKLLTASAITKEDYAKNPQAVIEVLEFYTDITKRAQNPQQYLSLTPTPPVNAGANKQLGYGMGGGASIAPPRPINPNVQGNELQRMESYSGETLRGTPPRSETNTPTPPPSQRRPSGPEYQQQQRTPPQHTPYSNGSSNQTIDQRRQEPQQPQMRQVQPGDREQTGREDGFDDYDDIPKTRTPLAKQEIGMFGGGGGDNSPSSRYNPARTAPAAPVGNDKSRQPPAAQSLRQMPAQRQAPIAPSATNGGLTRPAQTLKQQPGSTSRDHSPKAPVGLNVNKYDNQAQRGPPSPRFPQPSNSQSAQQPQGRTPQANGHPQAQPPSRLPAPVGAPKPLNVAKQPTGAPVAQSTAKSAAVQQAEAALTKKDPAQTRKEDVRMSGMSEDQIMSKLREVVSKDDPNASYSKQKKIGQGASGSVYVAKVLEDAKSPTARTVLKNNRGRGKPQVAIKQMDLNNQPRKELIVNEIIVMKESTHPNIVNFLDAFLRGPNELWVVMEYMEGGALTDVIDNNPEISEAQIATICHEVSLLLHISMMIMTRTSS